MSTYLPSIVLSLFHRLAFQHSSLWFKYSLFLSRLVGYFRREDIGMPMNLYALFACILSKLLGIYTVGGSTVVFYRDS